MKFNVVNWNGTIAVNGKTLTASVPEVKDGDEITYYAKREIKETESKEQFVITVKPYMTRKATLEFNFMEQWNNNNPMPLLTMIGTVEKETRGMIYMKLHGDVVAEVMNTCLRCGKPITNDVSKYFGLGPVCGNHNYVNPFATSEELHREVEKYRVQYLQSIVWEGWIIKSAIIERKKI